MADNRATAFRFLLNKGLTRAQAAGVVGSLMQESGLQTGAKNPTSGALGIAQWLGGRKTNLLNRGNSGSLNSQLNFLWSELQGPERAALDRLKGAHTVEDAAGAFTWGFERPGRAEANMPNRVRQGRAALDLVGDGGGSGEEEPPSTTRYRTTTTTTPGVDNRQARAQLVLSFLNKKNNMDPLYFATQAKALRDVPATTTTTRQRIGGGGGGSNVYGSDASSLGEFAQKRADIIDEQKLPYSWGGGHAGKTKINKAIPLDCSGAVSKVLGIDPRVADQFKTWGRPGDGGEKGVTVYSKPTHVLMKINGHFFGTSTTNPGGGAGWIPQGAVSKDYLAGFTARHSER